MKPVILMMSLILILPVFGQQSNNSKTAAPEVGQEAPTFSLPDINQKYTALRDFCGPQLNKPWINKIKHVVVMSFFATWCKPCMKEIPHLDRIKTNFAGQPVKFFLIDVGEDEGKVKEFLGLNKVDLDILIDRYSKIAEKYDALTLPRLYVIDKDGKVRKEQKGFEDPEQFENQLTQILIDLLK